MNTSTTPIIELETEFCPLELFYPQIAGLGVAISRYHLAPNDAALSPLPIHLITWNLGKPGELPHKTSGVAAGTQC